MVKPRNFNSVGFATELFSRLTFSFMVPSRNSTDDDITRSAALLERTRIMMSSAYLTNLWPLDSRSLSNS